MDRIEELNDDTIDLGVASVETKGAPGNLIEFEEMIVTGALAE